MAALLKNKFLTIKTNSIGAELTSIKSNIDGCEYLWQANPDYWGRHAPVLFPVVGALYDDKYIYNGKTYSMGVHGFARDKQFEPAECTENRVTYRLSHDEDSLKIYPFKFELYVTYELADNKVINYYKVRNIDDKKLYFSIGAHPAFNCPIEEGTLFDDCYLEFEREEDILEAAKIMYLTHELFNNGALIFKNLKSNRIAIKSSKSEKEVTVSFAGFPYVGIWTRGEPHNAPFICIEPWYGVKDRKKCHGRIEEKEGILTIDKGGEFNCTFQIEIGQVSCSDA